MATPSRPQANLLNTVLSYWSTAANILDPSQAILAAPSVGLGTNYEYTIVATVERNGYMCG